MKTWRAALMAGALALGGCANFAPTVPAGYSGPTATIQESGFIEDATKGQLFHVAEVDGKPAYSSLQRTRRDNEGRGLSLRFSFVRQTVPATSVRLKLVGTHITGAPIQELGLRASGQFLTVEREVSFTPEPNAEYLVIGRLQPQGSDVWLVDTRTSRRVTP